MDLVDLMEESINLFITSRGEGLDMGQQLVAASRMHAAQQLIRQQQEEIKKLKEIALQAGLTV